MTLGAWLRRTRQVRLVSKAADVRSAEEGVYVKRMVIEDEDIGKLLWVQEEGQCWGLEGGLRGRVAR
ncbi:hypothetical protein HBH98_161540 [Parastagonospora nodorum]|nr:hypothetical protein HBH53_038750 [Parastagonospora nodorum]KAH3984609.1 hypothetical protein HBH51_028890 [Parastagonospora nodorum]KAH4036635.1 hypothetical protein HBI09_075440 [Parastagonospora nodorum]KAH4342709.1 hypothetical protein HBH98_161540 [Parastagonospora nodorum]KAH4373201.1 hypothetical protein HBH97_130250 [Parastagonospora nodorum]